MEVGDRIKILEQLKSTLLSELSGIVSIYVYGSALCKNFGSLSDFDIIIIFEKDINIDMLEYIKNLNEKYKDLGIKLDISIHNVNEMIGVRKKLFWHNNRAVFIQREVVLYGKLIYGKNLFDDTIFSEQELKSECVRVINSLKYNARKLIFSSMDENTLKRRLLKLSLSSTIYALAFYNILPENRDDIYNVFDECLNLKIKATELMLIKMNNYGENLSCLEVKTKVYNFLSDLDLRVFNDAKDKNLII